MLPVRILASHSVPAGPPISTGDLLADAGLLEDRPLDQVIAKTGIKSRHFAPPGVTCANLGSAVLLGALAECGLAPSDLRRLIFTNSTGGDFLIPATANAVLHEAGIADTCDGFDVNNACMGFLSSMDLGARCVATGLGPVAIVVVELLSRFLKKSNPRPYLVLADAAVATILGPGRPGEGMLAAVFGNNGKERGRVTLAHSGLSKQDESICFRDSPQAMTESALALVRQSAGQVLMRAGLSMRDVDWVVPHQPNGSMLTAILAALEISPERTAKVVGEIGSVGAASMAMGLDRLLHTRDVRPGQRILFIGIGAGLSWGASLYQVGPC